MYKLDTNSLVHLDLYDSKKLNMMICSQLSEACRELWPSTFSCSLTTFQIFCSVNRRNWWWSQVVLWCNSTYCKGKSSFPECIINASTAYIVLGNNAKYLAVNTYSKQPFSDITALWFSTLGSQHTWAGNYLGIQIHFCNTGKLTV